MGVARVLTGIVILCVLLFGFGGAGISSKCNAADPSTTPQVIYVTRFDLEAQDTQPRTGPLQSRRQLRGPRANTGSAQEDPAARAQELVDLMCTSLVTELTKLGLNARSLSAGAPQPSEGLLVRGVFTQADEGNRLRRAVIGFGAGETELQLLIYVDDLSQGSPKPLYEIDTGDKSRKLPGAIITKNPYVAAAKFVLSGKDLDKNVTKTASKIAAEISERIRKEEKQ
jgi:hypothetical protein